jgi:ABC-2 type transport system permease protein
VSDRMTRSLVRIGAMAAKEARHIVRDPRTLYMSLGMPIVLLFLFGYGLSFDLDHVPVAVLDQDRTAKSLALVRTVTAPGELALAGELADPAEALTRFRRGEIAAALVIDRGYARDVLARKRVPVQLLVDGADPTVANQLLAKADALVRTDTRRLAGADLAGQAPPVELRTWTRYNPEGRSALFLVPGLAAYLMAITAVLLTALTVAGEWERGSMEQLFASPIGRFEIIAGKLLPYLVVGLLEFLLVIAFGMTAFDLPLRGSGLALSAMGLLFLVGMLGQGLLVSVLAKNQTVATQAGTMSSLLPSLLLSGMIFPIENMPPPLQVISRLVPARYLVHGLRGVILKGNGFAQLWPDLAALAVFALAVLALAIARFQRRLA